MLVVLWDGSGFPNARLRIGLAEAQRLKQGPDMGFNWIGSAGYAVYTKLWPVDLARGQAGNTRKRVLNFRPELRQDYPLNLSISISGGKETNQDALSNGERTAQSPT